MIPLLPAVLWPCVESCVVVAVTVAGVAVGSVLNASGATKLALATMLANPRPKYWPLCSAVQMTATLCWPTESEADTV